MTHYTPLISTIAVGLALAFLFALAAQRVKLPPIVGYLLAGIFVGPFTPGFVANQQLATELAEIGVILLMFGVGLHFSVKDLRAVRSLALPGAVGQIAVATLMGVALALFMGWSVGAGIIFGLALSVASTVVLLRALQERGIVDTERGKIAVGWLIVEDLAMVLALVLIPATAELLGGNAQGVAGNPRISAMLGIDAMWGTVLFTIVKVAIFFAVMLVIGRRVIPLALHYVAHTGSRELFRLAVPAIALGVAYAAANLFGVSFALGAFFAGMVLAGSDLSAQAARDTLPLRDAFAVLFFVSVGMLLDPAVLVEHPLETFATFLIIVIGKSLAAYGIVRAFGHPNRTALTVSASLAQIGEFSFILIVLGVKLAVVPSLARDLVVAGAILSIIVNPFLFQFLGRWIDMPAPHDPDAPDSAEDGDGGEPTGLSGHLVLVGHGRVGQRVAKALRLQNIPFLVVEQEAPLIRALAEENTPDAVETIIGTAGQANILERLNLAGAKALITAIPDIFESGHLITEARKANPAITIIARAHSDADTDYLKGLGADHIVMGEEEIARGMIRAVMGNSSPVRGGGSA